MREILARNVTLDEENEEREEFLTSIGLNPIWLHEMKAALAINKKEYKSAVKHLIGGKFYNRAHNVSSNVNLRIPLWRYWRWNLRGW